ncbi:MAG: hypothetical protein ACREUE_11930 [Panacagrimonas sp.]
MASARLKPNASILLRLAAAQEGARLPEEEASALERRAFGAAHGARRAAARRRTIAENLSDVHYLSSRNRIR